MMSPILTAACERAWAAQLADLTLSANDAAEAAGITASTLSKWITRRRLTGHLAALRSQAGLPIYPSNRAPAGEPATPEKLPRFEAAVRGYIRGEYTTIFLAAKAHDVTATELYRYIHDTRKRNPAERPAPGKRLKAKGERAAA